MFKNLITTALAVFCMAAAFAQTKTDTTETKPRGVNLAMGFEPVFGLNNCFKVDFEAHPVGHLLGYELMPELYAGNHIFNNNNDHISGYGVGLYQKFFVLQTDGRHPIMLAYGATYRNINVTYNDEGYIPYTQNGLNYYRYGTFTDVLKNTSLLANMYVSGRVADVPDTFFLDLYFGFGYKFAKQESNFSGYRNYNGYIYDYGYRGFAFLAGFKLGFQYAIKKQH